MPCLPEVEVSAFDVKGMGGVSGVMRKGALMATSALAC